MKVALLGAESTGKSTLAAALARELQARGHAAVPVGEVLREWCQREGRTPQAHEQWAIAQEQERRVDAAAAGGALVLADTTSLMVAVYSAMLFADEALLPFALERLRAYDVVLLTGLDLPWVADGLQRDGPHVREPVDTRLREALAAGGIAYQVVYGTGEERVRQALQPILEKLGQRPPATGARWSWVCDKCSDPDCEHRLFAGVPRG